DLVSPASGRYQRTGPPSASAGTMIQPPGLPATVSGSLTDWPRAGPPPAASTAARSANRRRLDMGECSEGDSRVGPGGLVPQQVGALVLHRGAPADGLDPDDDVPGGAGPGGDADLVAVGEVECGRAGGAGAAVADVRARLEVQGVGPGQGAAGRPVGAGGQVGREP